MIRSSLAALLSVRNPVEAACALILAVCFVVFSVVAFRDGAAADFRALWYAGDYLAQGRADLIYPRDTDVFTMLPPPEWIEQLMAQGFHGEVYPFIYPPLWAWLAAQATRLMTFDTLLDWVAVINPVLMLVMLLAARSLAAPGMRLWLFLGLGLVVLMLTPVGLVALIQSQPQILVACLTVLAVERCERGAPRLAGVLLAVAAAIKLYPAFYVLFWLVCGRRQAALSFVLAGAVLGLLSMLLVGWPAHAAFLHMVKLISDTVLVTRQSFALETLVAQVFYFDTLELVPAPSTYTLDGQGMGWYVLAKPPILAAAFKLAQVAALVWLAVLFRRHPTQEARAMLWPLAFAVLSLLGPIAWSYHFLSAVAFVPALFGRFRPAPALALLALFILVLSSVASSFFADLIAEVKLVQVAGTVSMVALAVAFLVGLHRSDRAEAAATSA